MILKGKQAKEKLLQGINEISDVVKLTLGARGKTVLLGHPHKLGFRVSKDGVSVANGIKFDDDVVDYGASFIVNSADKTVDEAGDGTTTTTILTQSMCNDVYNEINLGKNPNELIKMLKDDLETVKKYISDKSLKIENTTQIEDIATISANNDPEIGVLIREIYDELGFEVEIDIVESDRKDTVYEAVNGFTMKDTGYSSTQFINNMEKSRVEFVNPMIYLFNGKVKSMNQHLIELFQSNADRNSEDFRPLVLIVEDIEETVLREIVMAFQNQMIFNVAIVQTNLIHEDRKNAFIDASIFLDGEYNEERIGGYGECEKVIIDRNTVTFINGKGNVKKHLKKLKDKKNKNIADERRIFALESSAAIIHVGGKIATEISEKKDRIEDSVCAVKSALEEGYCPGGSTVYIFSRIESELKTDIMKKALLECYQQLMKNAELEPFYYLKEIEDKGFGHGYNLIEDIVSNFYEDGILDSSKVLRVSLENAVHTACNFALIEAVVN
jgi:chaperonin GroEL